MFGQHEIQNTAPIDNSDKQLIIIFLDIEGVLFKEYGYKAIHMHCADFYLKKGLTLPNSFSRLDYDEALMDLFDEEAVKNLQSLIKKIEENGDEPRIVLSNNWRKTDDIRYLKWLFSPFLSPIYLLDKTSNDTYESKKIILENQGTEISVWLNKSNHKYNIKDYLILNENDYNFTLMFGDRFIHCPRLFGLNELSKSLNALQLATSTDKKEKGNEKATVAQPNSQNEISSLLNDVCNVYASSPRNMGQEKFDENIRRLYGKNKSLLKLKEAGISCFNIANFIDKNCLYLIENDNSTNPISTKVNLVTDIRYYFLYYMIKEGKANKNILSEVKNSFKYKLMRKIFFVKLFSIVDRSQSNSAFKGAALSGNIQALKQFYSFTKEIYACDVYTDYSDSIDALHNALYCHQFDDAIRLIRDILYFYACDENRAEWSGFKYKLGETQLSRTPFFIPQKSLNKLFKYCVMELIHFLNKRLNASDATLKYEKSLLNALSRLPEIFNLLELNHTENLLCLILQNSLGDKEEIISLYSDLLSKGIVQYKALDANFFRIYPELHFSLYPLLEQQASPKAITFLLIDILIRQFAIEPENSLGIKQCARELQACFDAYKTEHGILCFLIDEQLIDSALRDLLLITTKHRKTNYLYQFINNLTSYMPAKNKFLLSIEQFYQRLEKKHADLNVILRDFIYFVTLDSSIPKAMRILLLTYAVHMISINEHYNRDTKRNLKSMLNEKISHLKFELSLQNKSRR